MSARQRDRPLTGRSNMSSGRVGDAENFNPQISRPQTSSRSTGGASGCNSKSELNSSDTLFVSSARKIELNNPLYIHCPFDPQEQSPPVELSRPPILQMNRYKTTQAEDEPVRPVKPYTPKAFVDRLQAPTVCEQIDMASFEDENLKKGLCREFIDRNKQRLWKFDLRYMGKNPIQVYQQMMTEDGLIDKLRLYSKRESTLNLGSSEKVKINLSDEGFNSLGEIKHDPYLNSLTTSRNTRTAKITRLLAPNPDNSLVRSHVRGHNHTPEYGNFSQFTAYMNLNASTSLNR